MHGRNKLVFIFTIAVLLGLPLMAPSPAAACRLALPETFKPTPEGLTDWTPGPSSPRSPVPSPAISVLEISRGENDSLNPCQSYGRLNLSVSIPAASAHSIDDLGVYFRIVGGQDPGGIFGNVPFEARRIEGEEIHVIWLWWPDNSPATPLDMKVEAFFVIDNLEIGQSTVFEVLNEGAR